MSGEGLRRVAAVTAAIFLCSRAAALEGVPPFAWLPWGAPLAEMQGDAAVSVESGTGAGFGGTLGARSLKADRYILAPVLLRYGLWYGFEAYAIGPFVWGSSPQEYTDYRTGGTPPTYLERLTGFDGGDPSLGVRWLAWNVERGEERVFDLLVGAGVVLPLGTGVWNMSRYNYVTGPGRPDLASGSGAWRIAVTVEARLAGERWRCDTLLGYLASLSQEATAMEPPGSTIDVRVPSPALIRLAPAWKVSEAWWITGRVDGFAAARGGLIGGGFLAQTPGSLDALLDSYGNLINGSSGLWAGAGVRWQPAERVSVSAEASAPIVAHGLYRLWRAGITVTWGFKS